MSGAQRGPITTHVLDTMRGKPAAGVALTLERFDDAKSSWSELGRGTTDVDGRVVTLLPPGPAREGRYRLTFAVGAYWRAVGTTDAFYDQIPIEFRITRPESHYHVPLLLNPFGYSTYRGS